MNDDRTLLLNKTAICLAGILGAQAAMHVAIGAPGMSVAQPTTYHSPSGEYELWVNPGERMGRSTAKYRFLKGAETVWSGERDYTLRGVSVAANKAVTCKVVVAATPSTGEHIILMTVTTDSSPAQVRKFRVILNVVAATTNT